MARIEIKNARVGRIIQGKGFEAIESYQTRSGDTGETKYTVWTNSADQIPGEGTLVSVSGNISARAEEFQNNQGETIRFARMHVNQPKVTLLDMPNTAEPVQAAPDSWTQGFNSEAPF